MAPRGNEPATIPVRPHLALGGLLVAVAALAAVLWTAGVPRVPPNLHILLGLMGLTLVAQGVAYWYMPSFAKRAVVPAGLAAYAGPLLLAIAAAAAIIANVAKVGALLRPATVALGMALVLFPFTLAASVLAGPRWRGGVPFWRAGGHHERGDRAALAGFASSALWLATAGALLLFARTPSIALVGLAWLLGIAFFLLAALAHLAPRAAGVPLSWGAFVAGLVAANLGGALALWGFFAPVALDPIYSSVLLGGGLGLLGSALAHRPGAKAAGPRWREARVPLAAALVALAVAVFLLVAGFGVDARWSTLAFYALFVAAFLGTAGVTLLTLPVLFNQRPDKRFVLPSAAATLAGLAFLLLSAVVPVLRHPGAIAIAIGVALWLATLAPLRKPRRECPPDE